MPSWLSCHHSTGNFWYSWYTNCFLCVETTFRQTKLTLANKLLSTWWWGNGESLEQQITNSSSKPVIHMHLGGKEKKSINAHSHIVYYIWKCRDLSNCFFKCKNDNRWAKSRFVSIITGLAIMVSFLIFTMGWNYISMKLCLPTGPLFNPKMIHGYGAEMERWWQWKTGLGKKPIWMPSQTLLECPGHKPKPPQW